MVLESMVLLACASLVGASADDARKLTWKERADLGRPRGGYIAGVIAGEYVVAGGSYWENQQKQRTSGVEIFNPTTNSWRASTPLPGPRSDAASLALNNTLYVFGGTANGVTFKQAFAFQGEKWTALPAADLPEPRAFGVAVECQGAIYLMGGMSKAGDNSTLTNSASVWNPNSSNSAWQPLPPVPGPGLITHAVAEFGGKIYVMGGAAFEGGNVVNLNTVFQFDPQTNQWKRLADLPIRRRAWWGLGVSDGVLLFGGYTDDFETDVFEYQLPSEKFVHVGSMPHTICDAKFLRVGDSVIGTSGEVGPKLRGPWTIEAKL